MATREPIMTALLAAVAQAANFQTITRVVVNDPAFAPTPTVATPLKQPALILVEDVEHHVQAGAGTPSNRTINVMLMIWAQKPRDPSNPSAPDSSITGATLINTLLESVEACLANDDNVRGYFTLGGLVRRCWIAGTVEKVSGDLNPDGQAFLAVPVSILIP